MSTYRIIADSGSKIFTFLTSEVEISDGFIKFIDTHSRHRWIPLSRVYEVEVKK